MSHKNAEAYLSTIYTQIFKNELARRSNARTEGSPYNTDVAARNMKKNRYQDVLPYENYRVRIGKEIGSSVDQESYINASHLISVDPKIRYIATQGPLPATRGAFWQMVYEQKTRVVVMLAQEEENGHIKCHRYWPKRIGERLVLEEQGLEVQLTEEREYSDIECVVRTLSVSRTPVEGHIEGESEENQIVYQIHYSNWPDHGLPTSATTLLKVIRFANSIQAQRNEFEAFSSCSSATATETATPSTSQPGPMVVHCSAGVGRTGTFCVIDAALSLLGVPGYGIPARPLTDNETTQLVQSPVFASSPPSPTSPDKNEDIIHTLVERFRQQRMLMVQTPAQFGYCYIAVKEGYQSARRARSESDPGFGMRFHTPA